MTIGFERPVGPHLDLKELEYINALHQTDPNLRRDASLTAEDVVAYLCSRHGIDADLDYVKKVLMPGLAGALGENPDPVFDLLEITCILLIPHFVRVADSLKNARPHLGLPEQEDENELADEDFFKLVLDMILHDVGVADDSGEPPLLTRELMQAILECYGEAENARPQDIDAMLQEAGVFVQASHDTATSGSPVHLTPQVLARATTADLKLYKTEWEDSLSTHFDDVFSGTHLDAKSAKSGTSMTEISESEGELGSTDESVSKVKRLYTFSAIDYVAENFRSANFTMVLWITLVVAYFAHVADVNVVLGNLECDNFRSEFGCRIVNAVIAWLIIFAQLTVLGTAFVVLGSAGNSIYARNNCSSLLFILVGMAAMCFTCVVTYFYPRDFLVADTNRDDDLAAENFLGILTVILGATLMLFQLKSLLFVMCPSKWYEGSPFILSFLVSGTARKESRTKKAARWKTTTMVQNALQMHTSTGNSKSKTIGGKTSAYGNALLEFEATLYDREKAGGILWTFRKMWDGSIFDEEGVWLHARLLAGNFSQYFAALFFLILYGVLVRAFFFFEDDSTFAPTISPAPSQDPVSAAADELLPTMEYVLNLVNNIPNETVDLVWRRVNSNETAQFAAGALNAVPNSTLGGIVASTSTDTLGALLSLAQEALEARSRPETRFLQTEDEDDDFIDFITPDTWVLAVSLSSGFFVAVAVALALAIVWIPSSVSTILQFRSGVIGSLRDTDFQKYRSAPDLTAILFGSTFWGTVVGSTYILFIVAILVFLLFWEPTTGVVKLLVAQIVAIAITIGLKTLVLMFMRKIMFRGMFRVQPASSNVLMVVLECWSMGLTVGTVIARLAKLILVSAFYVGRLDTPLFAKGVGEIGAVPIDSYPVQFRKDLLLHDAHRHPYSERLGVVYMMKLRHAERFGRAPNSAWRLIVVMALMPWLRRFRVEEEALDSQKDPDEAEQSLGLEGFNKAGKLSTKVDELSLLRQRVAELELQNAALREERGDRDP